MGALGRIGKGVLVVALGALGVLAVVRVADDRHVDEIWKMLEKEPAGKEVFSEKMVAGLPDPARRYFLHAIKPGTPLANRVHWRWSGEMKPGKELSWMGLTSEQISVKDRGFAWKVRAGSGALVLTGVDSYLDGLGRMRISLYGLLPIVNEAGPDVSRSALGRFVLEGAVLPSALLPGPNVQIEGVDGSRFTATVSLHGEKVPITITVDQEGRPVESVMQRWGNLTEDGSYRYIPYGGVLQEEGTFGGYTIPTRLSGGWWYGTDRYLEVIHLKVDSAQYD